MIFFENIQICTIDTCFPVWISIIQRYSLFIGVQCCDSFKRVWGTYHPPNFRISSRVEGVKFQFFNNFIFLFCLKIYLKINTKWKEKKKICPILRNVRLERFHYIIIIIIVVSKKRRAGTSGEGEVTSERISNPFWSQISLTQLSKTHSNVVMAILLRVPSRCV